jgi:cyclopropane-fatty-acyl-phospholipid synthase
MAEAYPGARITAVSNSNSQRASIEATARARRLGNLSVITADMNDFQPLGRYDRIVSVEMFEHMANWRALLERARSWLKPQGRVFIHVFSHKTAPYRFDVADPADWIGKYFFAGGVMPSHDLIRAFDDLFTVEAEWRWSGLHYQRTALQWLERFDAAPEAVEAVMRQTYGASARTWSRRWRLFFLATAGLFGHRGGEEWGVSHYRLAPAAS